MLVTELQDFFAPEIQAGTAVFELSTSQAVKALEECYPFAVGRVYWQKLPRFLDLSPQYLADDEAFLRHHSERIRAFLSAIPELQAMDPSESVDVVGDSHDGQYRMTFGVFMSSLSRVLNPGEHIYVVPADARWCIGFMMELDVYFGTKPSWKPRRRSA